MISYLKGKIILKKDLGKERFVVLDACGVGYKVFLSKKTFSSQEIAASVASTLPPRNDRSMELFCYLYVRENVMDLYGFANWEEREVFELLLGISGVGPKAAIEISALGPMEKLKKAIDTGDGKIFEGIPGIGRKRIAKILLELSGKIKGIGAPAGKAAVADEDPCVDALVNMGFSKMQARRVLEQIPKSMSEEDRIKEALKQLK
jgi:Holliday junction DNA helicase RuvA